MRILGFLILTLSVFTCSLRASSHYNDTLAAEMVGLAYDLPHKKTWRQWTFHPLVEEEITYGALFCPPPQKRATWPVLALRGTDKGEDWLTNSFLVKVSCYLCDLNTAQVHAGFYLRAQQVLGLINGLLRRWPCRHPASGLVMAGHSLGGAVANLLTAIWPEEHLPIHRLVTFGAPAVGDEVFLEALELKVLQQNHYILVGDLVPESLGIFEVVKSLWQKTSARKTARAYLESLGFMGPLLNISPGQRSTFVTSPYQISLFSMTCAREAVEKIRGSEALEVGHFSKIMPHAMVCYITALGEMERVKRFLGDL